MYAKRLISAVALGSILLAACAPSPTQTPRIISTALVNEAGQYPTSAVEATQVAEYHPPSATQPAEQEALPAATLSPIIVPPPEATPVDMFFEDYGVNPFIDTAEDNL